MPVQLDQYAVSYTWLSTDPRPPVGRPGNMGRETDTGVMFRSDGVQWLPIATAPGSDVVTHILLRELVDEMRLTRRYLSGLAGGALGLPAEKEL